MQSIDGGWSAWADEYQPCSRSCGGGVQFKQRHCSAPRYVSNIGEVKPECLSDSAER